MYRSCTDAEIMQFLMTAEPYELEFANKYTVTYFYSRPDDGYIYLFQYQNEAELIMQKFKRR